MGELSPGWVAGVDDISFSRRARWCEEKERNLLQGPDGLPLLDHGSGWSSTRIGSRHPFRTISPLEVAPGETSWLPRRCSDWWVPPS